MKSEKVKEIKKALEENANGSEHTHLAYIEDYRVKLVAYRDILTLINELESENDCKDIEISKQEYQIGKLKDRIAELENIGLNEEMTIGEYLREMQMLKDRIAELEKEIEENAFYSKGYAQGIKNTYEVVIPDKLKQFAERLKAKMPCEEVFKGIWDKIDETLKEFIDDAN